MKRATLVILFVLLALVLSGERAFSEQESQLRILGARADQDQGVVLIDGVHFRCRAPHVRLSQIELSVLNCSPTHILALLPGKLLPGSYRLMVYAVRGSARKDSIDIAIGMTGPAGPSGPQGLSGHDGIAGDLGPVGPSGSQGPQGPQGTRGADGGQGPSGPMGPIGLQGPPGSSGPQGPTGPAGASLVMHWTWSTQTNVQQCCNWVALPDSTRMVTTNGGPLLIHVDVALTGGANGTCAPFIDGRWAGEYGGLPNGNPDPASPFWREGFVQTQWGAVHWSPTRVYPNVPAGTYIFDVRCASDSGGLRVNAPPNITSSYVSIVELR